MYQETAFATGILPDLYGFHPSTWNSVSLFHTQAYQFRMQFSSWAWGFHILLSKPPTCALRPVIPNNASTPRITAAAGTELAGASSEVKVKRLTPPSSLPKGVYDSKAFFLHAASLHQAFAHCAIFPTAASRRSLGRVSVPVWLIILSDQLPIVALVGHYPTNKLIGGRLIRKR